MNSRPQGGCRRQLEFTFPRYKLRIQLIIAKSRHPPPEMTSRYHCYAGKDKVLMYQAETAKNDHKNSWFSRKRREPQVCEIFMDNIENIIHPNSLANKYLCWHRFVVDLKKCLIGTDRKLNIALKFINNITITLFSPWR